MRSERLERERAEPRRVARDRRDRRIEQEREGEVVEADDGDVAGDAQPKVAATPTAALFRHAGARPDRALAQARAWAARTERRGLVQVSVRLPRTAAEALVDVRYFAAQRYEAVVVAGPRARAAGGREAAAGRFAHTRLERRPLGGL